MRERAILVTIGNSDASELEELSRAARLEVLQTLKVKNDRPNAALFIGKGKVEDLARLAKEDKANVLVFDADLSASQQRNIEEIVKVKTVDRTQLILDIFALRARSREGKLQVELAQLQYLLPRLGGEGIYLSRLGGGVGTRGPGEQKLEMDRRVLRDRIVRISRELKEMQKRRGQAIERKKEQGLPLVALVGYTNAGKSTLFNRLTRSDVLVKDQLFSTLDTTTRLLELPGNQKALMVDTVGFVRRLPHHLVEAFKATLEEAVQADILLHVADASRPDLKEISRAVEEILEELGADASKIILVLNKADKRSLVFPPDGSTFAVSALTGEGCAALTAFLSQNLSRDRQLEEVFIPRSKLGLTDFLYAQAEVLQRKDSSQGARFQVRMSSKNLKILEERLRQ